MKITYRREGDYLLPNLVAPDAPEIGKYGRLRKCYLRERKNGLYTAMLLSNKLNAHLEEIDRSANEMLDNLVEQMAKNEGVDEAFKARNQLEWVRRMNTIRASAEEIVLRELVFGG